ncbi:toxin [Streptomyces albus subsp. albus]|nr:toxin [Streptomyces albus subsp. albus]
MSTTPPLAWFKSSYSDSSNGSECVEVAAASDAVLVRDSKNTQGPRLALTPTAWAAFVPYAGGGGGEGR